MNLKGSRKGLLTIDRVRNRSPEGMDREVSKVSGIVHNPLKVISERRIVEQPIGQAAMSCHRPQDRETELRRIHTQFKEVVAGRHAELPQLRRARNAHEHVVPECQRKQKCRDIELELAVLVSWNCIPTLDFSRWSSRKKALRPGANVHFIFWIFVILGPALHDVHNDFRSATRKREEVNVHILKRDQRVLIPTAGVRGSSHSPSQPFEDEMILATARPFLHRPAVLKECPDPGPGVAIR